MKISNYNYGTNKYKNKSTKPEDYDFKGFGDSLVSSAMNRLNEAKSPAPQVSFETDTVDSIYGNTNFSDTNSDFLLKPQQETTVREGTRIKNNVYEASKIYYPEVKINGVFDNISDEEIEANIPKARELTQSAEKSNPGFSPNPFMQDAISLFLAAGMKGDKNAANTAYKLAYTPQQTNPSDNKNEGKSTGESIVKVDYDVVPKPAVENSNSNDYNLKEDVDEPQKVNEPITYNQETNTSSVFFDNTEFTKSKFPTVYYGDTWEGKPQLDLDYGKTSKEDLCKLKYINQTDFLLNEQGHILSLRALANLTSSGEMRGVVNDMVTHFLDGTGTEYRNETLTKVVSEHEKTKAYMNDFTEVFKEFLENNNGNIDSFANSDDFKEALRNNRVLLSLYDYGIMDTFSGLTMAIHSWTESEVGVEKFNVLPNGNYYGSLKFTFVDNFGLNSPDIDKFGAFPGFRSWYILQHYDKYNGKYQPFKTVVTISYPFWGKM